MTTNQREETRTKLSGKAIPFRPSFGDLSTSSSLCHSQAGALHPNYCSDVDTSTGSVGSWSTPGSWTPTGYFAGAGPAWSSSGYGWPASSSFTSDSQGAPSSPSNGKGESGQGEFKLGDFSSKILKRAQNQASQEPTYQRNGGDANWANGWMLTSDVFPVPRSVNGQGDRRQAMSFCLELAPLPDPVEILESKSMRRPILAPLQHAASFNEGVPTQKASEEALPVKRTFIHYKASDEEGPAGPAFQWASAPAIIMEKEFQTKYPGMELAHIRGECRPCVYFTKKQDGCRRGADCEFCHLCPLGSLQRKRKEKIKAIREQEFLEKSRRFIGASRRRDREQIHSEHRN